MAEPENHTLRLLREIRTVMESMNGKMDTMNNKMDRNYDDLAQRIESLRKVAFGESVLGRYAAAEVEERLDALERRVATLEQDR